MKKLSEINESVFKNAIHRSNDTNVIRTEDEYTNIKNIKAIDLGLSVMWGDVDLETKDDVRFDYNEIDDLISGTGWRLPTLEEYIELKNEIIKIENDDDEYSVFFPGGKSLTFKKRGFKYRRTNTIDFEFYYGWSQTSNKPKENKDVFVLTPANKVELTRPNYPDPIFGNVTMRSDDGTRLSVRLVRGR